MAAYKSTKGLPPIRKGDVFVRWTALEDEKYAFFRGKNRWAVLCECSCADKTVKLVSRDHLLSGASGGCGCASVELTTARLTKHGMSHSPEHNAWEGLKGRCLNPNNPCYPYYGGRGIAVCERWTHSFENFLSDMGMMPSPGLQVERLDNSLGYSPDNCVWATRIQQMRNTRRNILLTYQGETLCVAEWSERIGIGYAVLIGRFRAGWPPDKILTTPILRGGVKTFFGKR